MSEERAPVDPSITDREVSFQRTRDFVSGASGSSPTGETSAQLDEKDDFFSRGTLDPDEEEFVQGVSPNQPEASQSPRMATSEERNEYLLGQRKYLSESYDYFAEKNRSLHPTQPGEQPALISIKDVMQEHVAGDSWVSDDEKSQEVQIQTSSTRRRCAENFVDAELPFEKMQDYLKTFSEEDHREIEREMVNIIKRNMQTRDPHLVHLEGDTYVQFDRDPKWVDEFKANYPQLRDQRRSGLLRRGLGKAGDAAGKAGEVAGNIGQAYRSGELSQAVGIGLKNYYKNLNPKNFFEKDWNWRAGFAVGATESVLFTAFAPIPGANGWIKAGLNLAITQGGHVALNVARSRQELKAGRTFVDDQDALLARMTEIERKYGGAHQKLKNFALGMSAGAMYLSLCSFVSEVGKEALGLDMQKMFQERLEQGNGVPAAETPDLPGSGDIAAPAPESAQSGAGGANLGGHEAADDLGAQDTSVMGGDQAPPIVTPDNAPAVVPPIPTAPVAPAMPANLPDAAPIQPAVSAVSPLPETINLPEGSNPWTEVKGYLHDSLGRDPSGPEIQEAVNKVLAENNIADAHNVQPGSLKIHGVNEYINQLNGGKSIPSVEPAVNIKAAEVGKVLSSAQDEAVKKALEQSHLTPSGIDQAAVDKAHQAVQNALEIKANAVYDAAGSNTGAGQQTFESWLATNATHSRLAETAQNAFVEQAQAADALTHQVSTALEATPNLYADQAIAHGTNVGQMLHDAGYQVTWTRADAEMLGAHIAANHDMLAKMTHDMAANHNIPENPFSVGMTEIYDLVTKAQNGDSSALRRLFEALRYIPEGQKFRILNKAGISIAMAALRK